MNKIIIILLWCIPLTVYAKQDCHLHTPNGGLKGESTPVLIGPFPNRQLCMQENARTYQLKGRCHCVFSNSVMPFLQNKYQIEDQSINFR